MKKFNLNLPSVLSGREFDFIKLLDNNGKIYNEIKLKSAIEISKEMGLDIVCFKDKDGQNLPFCKMINYGKWKYNEDKKAKKQTKSNKKTKEVRVGINIEQNDLNHKIKQAKEFLNNGDDVIFSMLLKGRQKGRLKDAIVKMDEIKEICSDCGVEISRKSVVPNVTIRIAPLKTKN